MQENQCEACALLEKDVEAINTRLQTMEHSHARMKEAFPKNDLGLPNYDGHRTEHIQHKKQEEVIEGYKRDTTKSILSAIALFIAGIFSTGIREWLKTHLK